MHSYYPYPVPALIDAGDDYLCIIYEQILHASLLRSLSYNTLLQATPFVGKSSFLYYYMMRLINSQNIKFAPFSSNLSIKKAEGYYSSSRQEFGFLNELQAYTYKIGGNN